MTTISHPSAPLPSPRAHLASAGTRALLRKYVARRVPAADVEDVVQATLCDAIASGQAPGQAEDFRRWVLAIARFKVVDAHRAAGRYRASDACDAVAPPPPVEEMSMLRWAERQMPGTASSTLRWMMREAEGDKLESIAADEALPPARVRQRVSRLRRFLRERWLVEMALVTALAVAAGSVLTGRHEGILPELEGAASVSSDPRLVGHWTLVSFSSPHELAPARRALLDQLLGDLDASFDGQKLRATGVGGTLQRTFTVRARGGQFEAMNAANGDRIAGTYAFDGDEVAITIANGPWAGVARLRPRP